MKNIFISLFLFILLSFYAHSDKKHDHKEEFKLSSIAIKKLGIKFSKVKSHKGLWNIPVRALVLSKNKKGIYIKEGEELHWSEVEVIKIMKEIYQVKIKGINETELEVVSNNVDLVRNAHIFSQMSGDELSHGH